MSDNNTLSMQIWRTNAGAHLFNGITKMNLVHEDGRPVLFSERLHLSDKVIDILIAEGLRPADMTQRVVSNDR